MAASADRRTANRTEIGERKRARTRDRLIKAAMNVFARLGPDAPAIDDFIAEAGVARGTFYNYFETRDELLIAVAAEVSDQLLTQMEVVRRLSDPAERVGCSMRLFVRRAEQDAVAGWIIARIALVAAPLGPVMRDYIAHDVETGLANGRFRCASSQAAYDLILGFGAMAMRSVLRGDAGPEHGEHVAQMALTALGVPDAARVARLSMSERDLAARARRARSPPASVAVSPARAKPVKTCGP